MRLQHVCCILTVACASSLSPAEDSLEKRSLADRPLAMLLAKLSNGPEDERQQVRDALDGVVMAICADAAQERLEPVFVELRPIYADNDDERVPVRKEQIASWKRELVSLTPRLLDYLAQKPVSEWSPVIDMLVIVDPHGALLVNQRDRLLTDSTRWSITYGTILELGGVVAPRERSILAPVVAELRALTPAKRRSLNQELNEQAFWLFGPTTAGIAIMLAQADRVQVELPYLSALIAHDQPSVLRMMSLAVLTELREDAVPALATIRRQLQDKDSQMRLLAAGAIAAISPRTVNVELLAKQAALEGDDLTAFREAAREYVADATQLDQSVRAEFDEHYKELSLGLLRSRSQFYVRQGLRVVITAESAAHSARQQVENLLESVQLDAETRRLAELAIDSLQ